MSRVVVVTGATSGIGAATAIAFARRGDAIGLIGRRAEELAGVAAECERAGAPKTCVALADVGRRTEAVAAISSVRAALGPVDVLVDNAGMPGGAPFSELSVEMIERVMRVNYLGAVACAHAVLDEMLERRSGTIVNVASIAGRIGVPRAGAYSASKFALVGWSEAADAELRHRGVRMLLVHPGPVRTDSFPHPAVTGRLLRTPEQVARTILRSVDRGRPEVMIPWYYRIAPVIGAVAPGLYRMLLRTFRARTTHAPNDDVDTFS